MLPLRLRPFTFSMDEESKINGFNPASTPQYKKRYSSVDHVGLRILLHQLSQRKSNLVVKPNFKLKKPTFRTNQIDPPTPTCFYSHQSSFLKSCHLCNNNLSLDKDVYMYRGDQGFCSVECRNRQIYLDEMKEIEENTKKTIASFRHRRPGDRCETRAVLEQVRHRHGPLLTVRKDSALVL